MRQLGQVVHVSEQFNAPLAESFFVYSLYIVHPASK